MIVDAWYMVSEYKLNLGPSDALERTVLYSRKKRTPSDPKRSEVLLAYLRYSDDNQLKEYMGAVT